MMMNAVVLTQYGPPEMLRPQTIPRPTPKANHILVKVAATSVNYGDLVARNFRGVTPQEFNMPFLFWGLAKLAFGLRRPKVTILGSEFAGTVEAVGQAVTSFKPGDAVFGYLGQAMGAYAEYVCLPEDGCVMLKPDHLSFAEAAVIPYGAIIAMPLLGRANIQPGQKVLVNGASGAIGAAAVQIAKQLGAEVTGVGSGPRLPFIQALGADKVMDYTQTDFTQTGERYDLIFDVLGRSSFAQTQNILNPGGQHLYVSFKGKQLWQMVRSQRSSRRAVCALAPSSRADFLAAAPLIAAGKLRGIVAKQYPLAEAAAAHRHIESKQHQGQIALIVETHP